MTQENLLNSLFLTHKYFCFFHALTVSLFEYLRLGKLQDDMEKRNIEFFLRQEKLKESTRLKGEFWPI